MPFALITSITGLLLIAAPVAAILIALAAVIAEVSGRGRLIGAMGDIFWEHGTGFITLSVPLFLLLGEITLRAGIATRMYRAVALWISWLPGGLMHANIAASALFASTSGSSVATIATIGVVAYPEAQSRKYHEGFFLGSLVAGGALGILIPPSVAMIIYGVMTNTSIPALYLAGLIPGGLMVAVFIATIFIVCWIKPELRGEKVQTTWAARWRCLPDLLAPALIFLAVVGSIYAGIATPSEAASLGVLVALIMAAVYGKLSFKMLLEAFERTISTSAMILFIVYASLFLNFVLGFSGIATSLVETFASYDLSPYMVLLILVGFYFILGMFMETMSMMLLTLPLTFPIIVGLGMAEFSDVWFGIFLVLMMEVALITPPVGMNLFVAQGIRTNGGKFSDVALGSMPFVASILTMVLLVILFPSIATWLPRSLGY